MNRLQGNNAKPKLHVSALYVYPIKSCSGLSLTEAEVGEAGFAHDREWMIVRENGWFITQRQYPRMALIKPAMAANSVRLSAPGMPDLDVPIANKYAPLSVRIWDDTLPAADQGDEAAGWLSKFLGAKCRLVHMVSKRPIGKKYQNSGKEMVSFADSLPFLLISQASLEDLNSRMDSSVEISRFRPNIVVAGGDAFQEDGWKKIRIANVTFRIAKACSRCEIITVDQETAMKDIEPMETLATYRYRTKGIMFGQNLVQENVGTVHVGNDIEVIA